ncbi:putative hydroxyindole O-methyltransferase [Calycina marina]|uniref:Hydroxyindole O-methyltransferase n=1 Tax=Calycina marina TaxID=1763456 RepID=A0A9P7YXJ6_9HELO|nr:putative hydroxyindole O-methyltransferase [Calycina marina]
MFAIVERIAAAGKAYEKNESGAWESSMNLSRAAIALLEIPSEFLQRSFWAEPALSAQVRLDVDVQLFQHLGDVCTDGVTCQVLSKKTSVVAFLLGLSRHLFPMNLVTFHERAFHATTLSNGLDEDISIISHSDVSRPSFNALSRCLRNTGVFNHVHPTQLPLFDWLVAIPSHLQRFGSFMTAYHAGKLNWYDPGLYLVADPLIILQDRKAVISSSAVDKVGFKVEAHDPSTLQPIKAARTYSRHSILHDWVSDNGMRALENLKPELKPGYSREHSAIAATSMDIMLAYFSVEERTGSDWKAIFEQAGLKFININMLPGVAESVIEDELAE